MIYPSLTYNMIQEMRLAHALMESRFTVCIPAEHAGKFKRLQQVFGICFATEITLGEKISLALSHDEPRTSVGALTRPLVFPQGILRLCRSLWRKERNIQVSFMGLVTGNRADLLEGWCRKNWFLVDRKMPNLNPFWHRVSSKAHRILGFPPSTLRLQIGDLLVWSSQRGRTFPVKAWDQEYYELLAASKFVFCPSGDCIWSYRFFEAILCGALPIVEKACPAYDGFAFYSMDDAVARMQWSKSLAESNFRLCADRITIPTDILNEELDRILAAGEKAKMGNDQ